MTEARDAKGGWVDAGGRPLPCRWLVTMPNGQVSPHGGTGRVPSLTIAYLAVTMPGRARWRVYEIDPDTGQRLRQVSRAELREVGRMHGRMWRPGNVFEMRRRRR